MFFISDKAIIKSDETVILNNSPHSSTFTNLTENDAHIMVSDDNINYLPLTVLSAGASKTLNITNKYLHISNDTITKVYVFNHLNTAFNHQNNETTNKLVSPNNETTFFRETNEYIKIGDKYVKTYEAISIDLYIPDEVEVFKYPNKIIVKSDKLIKQSVDYSLPLDKYSLKTFNFYGLPENTSITNAAISINTKSNLDELNVQVQHPILTKGEKKSIRFITA